MFTCHAYSRSLTFIRTQNDFSTCPYFYVTVLDPQETSDASDAHFYENLANCKSNDLDHCRSAAASKGSLHSNFHDEDDRSNEENHPADHTYGTHIAHVSSEGTNMPNQYSDSKTYYKNYSRAKEMTSVHPTIMQKIRHGRKFIRLAMRSREGMYQSDLLRMSIWFEPETIITPPLDDIIVGLSENAFDMPVLEANQRIITPVLVCMPHEASFSRPLSICIPLLVAPAPESSLKVLYSNTDVTEETRWQETSDVQWFIHDDQVSLFLKHFCLYCLVEQKVNHNQAAEIRHRIVSVFVRSVIILSLTTLLLS